MSSLEILQHIGQLRLDGVELSASALLGPLHEGLALLEYGVDHAIAARLAEAGRDGVLSCHEDIQQTAFGYLYSLERAATPGPFSRTLLAANARHFPVHPDGLVDGCPIEGGIVFNRHDGSFEARRVSSRMPSPLASRCVGSKTRPLQSMLSTMMTPPDRSFPPATSMRSRWRARPRAATGTSACWW